MNIAITFRHLESSDAVKNYASEKIGRLQKFLRQPMRAKVTLSVENKLMKCEAEVNAGSGHYIAHVSGADMHASIDAVHDKLERQISHDHGAKIAQAKGGESAGEFAARGSGPVEEP